jgi:hypothetical protein
VQRQPREASLGRTDGGEVSVGARASGVGGLLLVTRSAMFSGVAVALAGAAHTIAGGASPSALLLAGAFVVLTQLVVLLVPRERGFLPVATLLVASQLVLHFVFVAFHAHPSAVGADGLLRSGGIGPMGWGHLVAVLGAAWWLRRGEAHACRLARGAVCALTRRLLTALRAVGGPQLVQQSLSSVRVAGHSRALRSRVPRASVRRRGPPVGAVASPG